MGLDVWLCWQIMSDLICTTQGLNDLFITQLIYRRFEVKHARTNVLWLKHRQITTICNIQYVYKAEIWKLICFKFFCRLKMTIKMRNRTSGSRFIPVNSYHKYHTLVAGSKSKRSEISLGFVTMWWNYTFQNLLILEFVLFFLRRYSCVKHDLRPISSLLVVAKMLCPGNSCVVTRSGDLKWSLWQVSRCVFIDRPEKNGYQKYKSSALTSITMWFVQSCPLSREWLKYPGNSSNFSLNIKQLML